MPLEYNIALIVIFFIIAILYASAGFGGGSSYIATLALFPIDFTSVRMIALICNIIVVSGALHLFYKNNLLRVRKSLPLVALSIPLAFIGGSIKISDSNFYILLGFTLLIAAISMLVSNKSQTKKIPKYSNAVIGGGIGFISGMVGIGGGIFLSPVLHLSNWNTPKVIAATTALFILVNSIAGLTGQLYINNSNLNITLLLLLILSVFLGGQIGSRLTISILKPLVVKKIAALLILFVAIRILYQYLL